LIPSSTILCFLVLPPSLFSFGWLVVILGGTDHWMWDWQDEHGLREEEDLHIDGWIMHDVISFMTEGNVHIHKRWRRDKFLMFLISDSVTLCSSQRKHRCCGDSGAEWSQHQWKRC
jgi:hypothetical protein